MVDGGNWCVLYLLFLEYLQGGHRFFSRREITALVGGPNNMVHRYTSVIPPIAKGLPPKNEKPPTAKTYRRLALQPKNTAIFLFHRYR